MGIWLAVVNLAGGVKQGPLTGNWHGSIYNNAKKIEMCLEGDLQERGHCILWRPRRRGWTPILYFEVGRGRDAAFTC